MENLIFCAVTSQINTKNFVVLVSSEVKLEQRIFWKSFTQIIQLAVHPHVH